MNRVKTLSLTLIALLACAALSQAQPKRAYISAKVSNTSGCGSLTTPCNTLSYVLANSLVASGGEVIAMDSGTYDTAGVTISIPLTVSAPTGVSAGFKGTTGGAITVAAGSSDAVVLRGLSLFGGDSGVYYQSGGTLHVENCLISRADSYGIYAEASGKLFVKDCEVRDVTSYTNSSGILLFPLSGSLTAYVDRTRVENCTSAGVYVSDGVTAFVRSSVVTGTGYGFLSEPGSTAAALTVDRCQVINNTKGIEARGTVASGSDINVINTTIARNGTGLSVLTGGSYQGRILSRIDSSSNKSNTLEANTTAGAFTTTFAAQ